MRRQPILLMLSLFFMLGGGFVAGVGICGSLLCGEDVTTGDGPQPTLTPALEERHVWKSAGKKSGLGDEWQFVCPSTGRTDDANVTKDDRGDYKLWVRGAGGGDYESLESAQRAAERFVRDRKWVCEP